MPTNGGIDSERLQSGSEIGCVPFNLRCSVRILGIDRIDPADLVKASHREFCALLAAPPVSGERGRGL